MGWGGVAIKFSVKKWEYRFATPATPKGEIAILFWEGMVTLESAWCLGWSYYCHTYHTFLIKKI